MRIVKICSILRGVIDPPEPLDEKENAFVSQLWQSYDIAGSTKIIRREYDWYGEGGNDSSRRGDISPESEFSS